MQAKVMLPAGQDGLFVVPSARDPFDDGRFKFTFHSLGPFEVKQAPGPYGALPIEAEAEGQ